MGSFVMTTPDSTRESVPIGQTQEGEDVVSNGVAGEAKLSICVPTWKDSADALLASLIRLQGAKECTLLIFDDGSFDETLTRQLARHIMKYPGPARLITSRANKGRSHARNRLMRMAETDWILFLDADMKPDDDAFLLRYLDAADATSEPALVAGGFSLKHAHPTAETRLHALQSETSECLNASARAKEPGRFIFTSNILVRREILDEISFDDGFKGWGWEDVDWGLRIAETYPVLHIDNPATHLGLDPDAVLMDKYARSGANFARLVSKNPTAMKATPLYRMSRLIRYIPGKRALKPLFAALAKWKLLTPRLRLLGLKLYRATVYAEHL